MKFTKLCLAATIGSFLAICLHSSHPLPGSTERGSGRIEIKQHLFATDEETPPSKQKRERTEVAIDEQTND